jgi:hypothetical protein
MLKHYILELIRIDMIRSRFLFVLPKLSAVGLGAWIDVYNRSEMILISF